MPVVARACGRLVFAVIVAVCAGVLLVVLAFGAPVAVAAGGPCSPAAFAAHEECRFGERGEGPGQFSGPVESVAVNQTTGHVYVLGGEDSRVEEFTGEGVFVRSFGEGLVRPEGKGGLAVDQGTGDVYVLDPRNARVQKYSAEGVFLLEFPISGGSGSLAVGPTGTVFVGEFGAVQEYDSAGNAGVRVELEGAESVSDLAIDSEGGIYVSEGTTEGFGVMHPVRRYSAAGVLLGVFDEVFEEQARSLTLDPATGEVFVNQGLPQAGVAQVSGFTAAGVQRSVFATTTGELREGIAFGEKTGALYIVTRQSHVTVVFPPPPGPVVSGESVDHTEPTAVLVHAVVNPDTSEEADTTSYWVEYGTSALYGSSAPLPEGTLPGSFNNDPVEVPLTGLQPRTEYHYRVVASDQCEKEPVAHSGVISTCETQGSDHTFTTLPPALVEEEFAGDVRSSSVTLHASVNPLGSSTTYRFLYSPCETGECAIPIPDQAIGSGKTLVQVEQHVQGLTAGQTYHYHLLATNLLGTETGPDRSFTTQTGGEAGLPDSREWELASPPDKQGALLEGSNENHYLQAAAMGDGIAYSASAPTESGPHGNGEAEGMQILARRSSSGWSNLDLAIPHSYPVGVTGELPYQAFSTDLSHGVLQPEGSFEPALSAEATEQGPYLRDNTTNVFTPLVTPKDDDTGLPFGEEQGEGQCVQVTCGPAFEDATPDLSHILLGVHGRNLHSKPLLKEASEGGLYEWSAGKLSPVGVLPPGTPELGGATLGGGQAGVMSHVVSDDGSRVFFAGRNGLLFMRDMTRKETIEIGEGEFQGASADGTLVFYSGHECEIPLAGTLECKPVLGEHGEELQDGSVLATGEDGTWVYFQEKESIYVRHGNGPAKQVAANIGHIKNPLTTSVLFPQEDPWRASPNGEWFAFASDQPLTGYDNRDAVTGRPDVEVYLYDAVAGRLVCASCDPTGARPRGAPPGSLKLAAYALRWEASFAASVPGWGPYANGFAVYDPRFISDQGRLFFNSVGALVPKDVNGQVDVYQYEPPGVGSCSESTETGTVLYSPAAHGCVGLISSGESPEESAFEDASVTGEDVFFLSSSRLSTLDLDGSLSLWDAHVCTVGSPCLPALVSRPPACDTEASCKAAPSSQPVVFGAPASATFVGVGNVVSGPLAVSRVAKHRTLVCRRGLVRRRGRCVRRGRKAAGKANHDGGHR